MCLYIPYLPIERLRSDRSSRRGSVSGHHGVAVIRRQGGVSRVVLCDGPAQAGGVRQGMTAAEARALLPDLHFVAENLQADRRTMEALADGAQAFAPIVHIEGRDTLLLDVSGCERLFRGERRLLSLALAGLRERGFSARGAVADTPGSAWAIGHAHEHAAVVTVPGHDVEHLRCLSVGALRVDGRCVEALRAVGVETVEALMYLPRASLRTRFGESLLHRLNQAFGNVPEPLVPFRVPPVVCCDLPFGAGTDRQDIIESAVERVLGEFCERLSQKVVGVNRLEVIFYHEECRPTAVELGVSHPTRLFERLKRLVMTRLEQVCLPAEVWGVAVRAGHVEPLDDSQGDLFDSVVEEGEALADLTDRLSARLGWSSVSGVVMVDDYQPECAYEYVRWVEDYEQAGRREGRKQKGLKERKEEGAWIPARAGMTGDRHEGKEGSAGWRRPLRVLAKPVEVAVVAVVPEGPPVLFRWQRAEHVIADAVGPERLETGWWRGPDVRRDYFRVVSTTGQGFWLFRDRRSWKWYVHGLFD